MLTMHFTRKKILSLVFKLSSALVKSILHFLFVGNCPSIEFSVRDYFQAVTSMEVGKHSKYVHFTYKYTCIEPCTTQIFF